MSAAWKLRTTVLVMGALFVSACSKTPEPPLPPPDRSQTDPADIAEQVHAFCGGSCHAYPPADSFPRKHWRAEVERGFKFFERSGLPLKAPPFFAVVRYYEKQAPEELEHARITPAAQPLTLKFRKQSYPNPPDGGKPAISHVNLVRLPPAGKPADKEPLSILACDMQTGRVLHLRPNDSKPEWKVLARLKNPAHAEVLDLDRDGIADIIVADLGSFPPTDRKCGSVVWLRGKADGSFTPITILENVGRVADVRAADFRGAGQLDLVVAAFGLIETGEILLLENRTTDWSKPKFEPRQVDARHGAIHVPVADLNGDGKPDFVALIAQEHETIVAFINDGKGGFEKKPLYNAPHPGWGSSGIQLVDLNGDGQLDVLYTNGDILDQPYLLKPYHGIQWLENKGGLKFEHHLIAPMYGAHNAVAADFFGTGRLGIAAVSFLPADKFPDRIPRKADAVILLEQVAPGKFERHSLATLDCDSVVCAAGDLYRTGRPDIVVGNFSSTTSDHPVTIWKNLGK
jgi:hypothetical protein